MKIQMTENFQPVKASSFYEVETYVSLMFMCQGNYIGFMLITKQCCILYCLEKTEDEFYY